MLKKTRLFGGVLFSAGALSLVLVLPDRAAAQVGAYPSGTYPSYAYPNYPAYRPSVPATPSNSSLINPYNGYIPGNTYRPGFYPGAASLYARVAPGVTRPNVSPSRFYIPTDTVADWGPAAYTAEIEVLVPDDAAVWFNDWKGKSTGPVRRFQSPSLTPGQKYEYTVKARWEENGRPVTQTRPAFVTAGARVRVDFFAPADSGAKNDKR
jgi:uncharacterized protein (TIGR03000 family)